MEMTAEVTYDARALRTLYLTKIVSLGSPYVSIACSIVLAVLVMVLAIAMRLLGIGSSSLLWLCMGIGVFLLLYDLFVFFIAPLSTEKARKKCGYGPVCFVFGETGFSVTITGKGMNEHTSMEYAAIPKVVETDDYLFLYLNKQAAYILKKSCLQGGTASELLSRITMFHNVRYQRKHF